MSKKIFVRDITGNQNEVNDLFVVTKKGTYTSKNNTRYMMIGLKDATGSIDGRVWERVDELEGLFERGDIVSVRSKARDYQGKPQLHITDIRKLDADLAERVGELTHHQLDALDQSLGRRGVRGGGGAVGGGALEVVEDGQELAQEIVAARALGVFELAPGALAEVVEVRGRAEELVLQSRRLRLGLSERIGALHGAGRFAAGVGAAGLSVRAGRLLLRRAIRWRALVGIVFVRR